MNDACEENRLLPINIVLHERSFKGVRSARIPKSTLGVTYAPNGRASHIAKLVPSVGDGGVVITWSDARFPRIRAVYHLREVLADIGDEVAVVKNDHSLTTPSVYEVIACVLRGEAVGPPKHYDYGVGIPLAKSARALLAALAIPGFV